jgi:AraC-like DNA-binding protein
VQNLIVSHNYFSLISGYLNQLKRQHSDIEELSDAGSVDTQLNELKSVYFVDDIEWVINQITSFSNDLSFGLTIGENIHPSDYGLVGYALMNCPNLNTALTLSSKYKPVMNQAFKSCFIRGEVDSSYQVTTDLDDKYLAALIELDFASGIQLAKLLVDKQDLSQLRLRQVNFRHGPLSSQSHYQRVFNCPVHFYQHKSEIIIDNSVLALEVRSANSAILDMLIRKIDQAVKSYSLGLTFCHQVINYVANSRGEIPSAKQAARHFNISLSTLKKRLMSEGRNYSEICDSMRKSLAIKMVANPIVQIKVVHCSLNFSSSSAFNRAFKRWTSMTPTEYRQRAIASQQPKVKALVSDSVSN